MREKFRFKRLEGLISYPLFIFCSKDVENEKRRYRKLVKRLFIEDVSEEIEEHNRGCNQIGERNVQFKAIALLRFSLSVLLTGMTFELGFRERKVIQKLSE